MLFDHCRIGSLEMLLTAVRFERLDHCRIGSLETTGKKSGQRLLGSLPHRQLRNYLLPKYR